LSLTITRERRKTYQISNTNNKKKTLSSLSEKKSLIVWKFILGFCWTFLLSILFIREITYFERTNVLCFRYLKKGLWMDFFRSTFLCSLFFLNVYYENQRLLIVKLIWKWFFKNVISHHLRFSQKSRRISHQLKYRSNINRFFGDFRS
jgi:hypothetical protein